MEFLSNLGHGVIRLITGTIVLAIIVYAVLWVYWDAERRGKSGCLAMLLVVLIPFPGGLIAWLLFRPNDRSRGL